MGEGKGRNPTYIRITVQIFSYTYRPPFQMEGRKGTRKSEEERPGMGGQDLGPQFFSGKYGGDIVDFVLW